MTQRITITLEDEVFAFLNHIASNNRSSYINQLLKKELQSILKVSLVKANQEEAEDVECQDEFKLWDKTLLDGLN